MRGLVVLALAAVATVASAQPAPTPPPPSCIACDRGNVVIDRLGLQAMRPLASQLAALPVSDPATADQYARIVDLRIGHPVLLRLGAVDDEADLAAIASALCRVEEGTCVDATLRTLRCLSDRCEVELPRPPTPEVIEPPPSCPSYVRARHRPTPPYGLGFEWGTGWQRSRYPNDGRAWVFGLEGRLRFKNRYGLVARVDRVNGLDAAVDADGNGLDDMETGPITRISVLGGPSLVLDHTRFEDTTRFARLDLLGGYISTRTQTSEGGPAAGVDLTYQLWSLRFGLRLVQGFAEARDATMLLGHVGIYRGSTPTLAGTAACSTTSTPSRSSRLALGLDFPLFGLSSNLGYAVGAVGVEAVWKLAWRFDLVTHADLIVYTNDDRSRVLHQAALGGLRAELRRRRHTHLFATAMGGYSLGSGLGASSGPVIDTALGWGWQGKEGGMHFRLHNRVGLDDTDYLALFLSIGFEIRLDPRRWRDRS